MTDPYPWVSVADIREQFTAQLGRDTDQMLELVGTSFVADEESIFGAVNHAYVAREVAWYDKQTLSIWDMVGEPPAIWQAIASKPQNVPFGRLRPGTINSNYGFLLYHRENGEQYRHVVDELHRDVNSRRAVAVYTRPNIHTESTRDGMQDFICTNAVQYVIRDSHLSVIVQMRSNDAVFGFRNDYAWQRIIQLRLLSDLEDRYYGLEPGPIVWQVGSLHVYPRHRHLVEHFAKTGEWNVNVRAGA